MNTVQYTPHHMGQSTIVFLFFFYDRLWPFGFAVSGENRLRDSPGKILLLRKHILSQILTKLTTTDFIEQKQTGYLHKSSFCICNRVDDYFLQCV